MMKDDRRDDDIAEELKPQPNHLFDDDEEDYDYGGDNNSYEQESLGLVYSVNSSNESNSYKIKRTGSNVSNSRQNGRNRSPFRLSSLNQYSQQERIKQQQQRQSRQQDTQQLEHQRWRRLPIAEDDYLDDDGIDDDLNSEWNHYEPNDNPSTTFPTKRLRNVGVCIVLISVLAVLIPRATKHRPTAVSDLVEAPRIKGTPQFTCPTIPDSSRLSSSNATTLSESEEDDSVTSSTATSTISTFVNTTLPSTFTYYDERVIQECKDFTLNISSNFDSFAANFRNSSYIPCGSDYTIFGNVSYHDLKQSIREWKVSHFLSNLKTGDSIYQSGAGIGLNLLLTLEILHEANDEHYITDLHVYGNDHIPMIAQLANLLLDVLSAQAGSAKRGVICAADSTSLHDFVPDDSFDLVYASSIPALPDPLELNTFWLNNTLEDNQQRMDELCSSIAAVSSPTTDNDGDTDWKALTLIELAQQRQNDWYALWVTDMIRIAKADTPVIIEYVGQSYCSSREGQTTPSKAKAALNVGVAKSFWKDAIIRYNWNIDLDTLQIVDDVLFPSTYHVFMKTKVKGT